MLDQHFCDEHLEIRQKYPHFHLNIYHFWSKSCENTHKAWKSRFWPAFGACNSPTLIKIHNRGWMATAKSAGQFNLHYECSVFVKQDVHWVSKRHYTLLSNQRCFIQSTTTYYDQPVLQTWTCGATCRKAATVHSFWNLFKPVLFFLRRGAIVLLCKKHETIFTFNEKKILSKLCFDFCNLV